MPRIIPNGTATYKRPKEETAKSMIAPLFFRKWRAKRSKKEIKKTGIGRPRASEYRLAIKKETTSQKVAPKRTGKIICPPFSKASFSYSHIAVQARAATKRVNT